MPRSVREAKEWIKSYCGDRDMLCRGLSKMKGNQVFAVYKSIRERGLVTLILCLSILIGCTNRVESYPFEVKTYSVDEYVNAIYWAEGGDNTNFPYGIRSVKCEGEKECRRICRNTIKNNIKRWEISREVNQLSYLKFLANRYCPIGADNDPTRLNRNWLKNVRWFLDHPKEIE